MRTRFLSALILAQMAILAPASLVPTTALADAAEYDRSDPAAGATIYAAPTAVTVWFTEELVSQGSSLEVRNAANARVDTGNSRVIDDASKNSMTIGLAPNLPNGAYTVSWMTVSAEDGDAGSGTFSFGIGVPAPAPSAETVVRNRDVPAGPPYDVSGTVVSLRGDNLDIKTGETDETGMDKVITIDASDISKRNISVGNSITLTVGPRMGDIPKAWTVVSQGSYTERTDFSPAHDQTRNETSNVKNQADDDEARNKQKHEKGAED